MKKIFKSKIFFLVVISFISLSVVFAYSYFAEDVGFTPTDNSWDVDNTSDALDTLYDKAKTCDFGCPYVANQVVFESGYIGMGERFNPQCVGNYKVELWGASAADVENLSNDNLNGYAKGGKGAYTSGTIALVPTDILYVYVGGKGVPRYYEGLGTATGGYNGGGNGYLRETGYLRQISSGGGATDIRYFGSLDPVQSTLAWDSDVGLNARIMVAAGGGGVHQNYISGSNNSIIDGGAAGGLNGYAGTVVSTGGFSSLTATGGTQTTGGQSSGGTSANDWQSNTLTNAYIGSFGKGASLENPSRSDICAGGGGGGYYGGATGVWKAAGGGSSFISGHLGCVAIKEGSTSNPRAVNISGCDSNPISNVNCSVHYSGKSFTDTVMIDGQGYAWTTTKASTSTGMPTHSGTATMTGNTGDGYAKITYLGK